MAGQLSDKLTPRKIVAELDKHIVGQDDAKRVVAIAVRNRWRRLQLSPEAREDVTPKNIMLIGPTGVGKTEIARRLASLVGAPFVKVEATRFTEVGYVGRDVDAMVRDLVEISISLVKGEAVKGVEKQAEAAVEDRLVELLTSKRKHDDEAAFAAEVEETKVKLRAGQLEKRMVDIQIEEKQVPFMQVFSPGGLEEVGFDLPGALGNVFPAKKASKKLSVGEARRILAQQESERLIDRERVTREGLQRAQEAGIVFIDEIDKVVAASRGAGPDVSREGVQRDLLPIVEGATVVTRYGPVRTDHVLFIAAGAFSHSKPTDLIPELQGRFPLRAELKDLTRDDFVRILREPQSALLKQAASLLSTEGVAVEFTDDAVGAMADAASEANAALQNIGARRLHTVVERVLEEISFTAPDISPTKIAINGVYVRQRLKGLLADEELRKYIL